MLVFFKPYLILIQLIIICLFLKIFEPLYGESTNGNILPFTIVDIEYQKKGGDVRTSLAPKYILYVVKAVLKEYPTDISENDVSKTLKAILQNVRDDAIQKREQIDGISAFLYISQEHINVGSIALGRIEWWPKGHSFNLNNVSNIENKSTYEEKIDIYSIPKTDIKFDNSKISKNIIGTWVNTYGISYTIIIFKNKSDYVIKKQFSDGSSSEKVLFIKKVNNEERLYEDPNNYYGDYIIITSDGKLEFYDNEGFIYSLSPVKD
jgi:hypothetical protein